MELLNRWSLYCNSLLIWTCFLSLTRSKLRLCSANHRPGYWSNLPCDWPSTAWAYSEQETENGPEWFHSQTYLHHDGIANCGLAVHLSNLHIAVVEAERHDLLMDVLLALHVCGGLARLVHATVHEARVMAVESETHTVSLYTSCILID